MNLEFGGKFICLEIEYCIQLKLDMIITDMLDIQKWSKKEQMVNKELLKKFLK